ncbi:MAG: AzlD domain-containing protein [Eubacterium sp.]|nr:AzlD domain-containing protein [Eubacterium sp.]
MNNTALILYILVMAGVTYLIRMLPLALFQREIKSIFIKSFLYYVPYAVLGSMTFPAIFSSTGSLPSALAGTLCAVVLALYEKGLVTVAVASCVTVLLVEGIVAVF